MSSVSSNNRRDRSCRVASYSVNAAVGPLHDRARQQFRVSQRIRNAVRGEWILEIPGVADESPSGPGAALDKTDLPAKPAYRLHPACLVEPRLEQWRHFANQATVCQRRVTVNFGAKAS